MSNPPYWILVGDDEEAFSLQRSKYLLWELVLLAPLVPALTMSLEHIHRDKFVKKASGIRATTFMIKFSDICLLQIIPSKSGGYNNGSTSSVEWGAQARHQMVNLLWGYLYGKWVLFFNVVQRECFWNCKSRRISSLQPSNIPTLFLLHGIFFIGIPNFKSALRASWPKRAQMYNT